MQSFTLHTCLRLSIFNKILHCSLTSVSAKYRWCLTFDAVYKRTSTKYTNKICLNQSMIWMKINIDLSVKSPMPIHSF